ncbi:MAG: GNAT family N-acetyltransferase [Chloroflexi bacterium]|nr:GNAT family N-acetyltransferase [Chloroflexota bacterium]
MTMTGSRHGAAIEGLQLRPLDPARDYEPIAELISSTNLADDLDWVMTAATLRHEIAPDGQFDPERDTRVAELDGTPVGFVRVYSRIRGPERKVVHRMDLWTRQGWRRRGIGTALVAWAEERSRRVAAGATLAPADAVHELSGFCDDRNAGSAAFAEALGFRLIRYTFEMRRDLGEPIPDLASPTGLEFRPVRAEDHRRIWDANVEAFRDHWEAAERTEADYDAWFADPETDTTLWRVAWDGDEVAGLSMNTIYAEENERLGIRAGWLEQVSVRRPWRRRGLGAAIIAASLRTFREQGMNEAMLGVDAENPTGALALYERLGFTRHRAFRIYRKGL